MRKTIFFLLILTESLITFSQTGKYFTATGEKCKGSKVYIDQRIQQYAGSAITIEWTGACKDGFASGNGLLTIALKAYGYSFTMTYNGHLVKGKKEGTGLLNLFLYGTPMPPYYTYSGSFKNDEFDGYGEFKADYPYPVDPDDVGKGFSMESLHLEMAIWRSDLFFYEYKGNFINGKIADTENGTGKTKKWNWVGKRAEYTGAVKNGIPNGKGFAGELDVTNFPPIRPNGQGRTTYTGNFVNGLLNGMGKEEGIYFEYEGEFVNGIREGKGKMTHFKWFDYFDLEAKKKNINPGLQLSSIIEASFKNGAADGFCTIYFQNSAAYKYTGPMKEGVLEGTGEIEYLDGAKLRGNFRNNKMEGEGSIIFANGDKFSGIYSDDKPVSGKFYYADGEKYEGGMTSREEKDASTQKLTEIYYRHGTGKITKKDGSSYNVKCEYGNCKED